METPLNTFRVELPDELVDLKKKTVKFGGEIKLTYNL